MWVCECLNHKVTVSFALRQKKNSWECLRHPVTVKAGGSGVTPQFPLKSQPTTKQYGTTTNWGCATSWAHTSLISFVM